MNKNHTEAETLKILFINPMAHLHRISKVKIFSEVTAEFKLKYKFSFNNWKIPSKIFNFKLSNCKILCVPK